MTALDPERHFGVGSWSFVLEELSGGRTRLLVRSRGEGWVKPLFEEVPPPKGIGAIIDYAVGEQLHHFMERRMMLGFAHRAEHAYMVGVPYEPSQAQ